MCYLKNVWYYCPLFPWLQMLRWFCQFYESFIRSTYRSDCMSVDLDDEWDKERWPLCNSWFLFKTYKNYITLDDVFWTLPVCVACDVQYFQWNFSVTYKNKKQKVSMSKFHSGRKFNSGSLDIGHSLEISWCMFCYWVC